MGMEIQSYDPSVSEPMFRLPGEVRLTLLTRFDVYGTPEPTPRHRSRIATVKPGWVGRGRPASLPAAQQFVQVYPDSKDKAWKAQIAAAGRRNWEGLPAMATAILLTTLFILPRPKSVTRKKREYPLVKPDLDNLIKAIKDSLSGVIWHDDALVIGYGPGTWKLYDDDGREPGVTIAVHKLT